ncbi:MAG TPA: hypothetical protein GXX29_12615 [Firmicutes bacterium]|nr:hypothetical protein [Bacillota bacterium]
MALLCMVLAGVLAVAGGGTGFPGGIASAAAAGGASTSGVSAADAAEQDTAPPVIRHEAITKAYSNANLIVKADVYDDSPLSRVTLFFRTKGTTTYYALNMNVVMGQYRTAIPYNYLQQGSIQYYIQAVDMAGNVATWPAVGAAKNPQNILVEKDNTIPQVELVLPKKAAPAAGFVAVVALNDLAGNIDPKTARVLVNGVDMTAEADISPTRVMLTVPPEMIGMRSHLYVEISDLAGNKVQRRFSLWKAVDWTRELRWEMTSGNKPVGIFNTAFSWGPLDLAVNVRSDDPVFTRIPGQPTSQYSLKYNARLMGLQLGDISSSQSPLAMSSMWHRGADLTLKLGPLAMQGVYGFPSLYVENDDYERKTMGVRASFDTRFLDFSLNVVKIKDQWTEEIGPTITDANPELNYVVDVAAGTGLFGDRLSLTMELAASLYFPNAVGNLWEMVEELEQDYDDLPEELQLIVDYTKKVPEGAREFLELPDITKGPVRADLGGQAVLTVPLPWSQLTARAYHFGPDYQTLYGAGDNNVDGYHAKFATSRWLNFLQFTAEYEQRQNNAVSLLDFIFKATPLPRQVTDNYKVGLSLGPAGRLNLDLAGDRQELKQKGVEVPDSIITGYTASLKNMRFRLLGMTFRFGGLYGIMAEEKPATPGLNKNTITYKTQGGLDIGRWSYDLGLAMKKEEDAAGQVVTTPSLDGAVTWRWQKPRLFIFRLHEIKLAAGAGISYSKDAQGTKFGEYTMCKAELEARITPSFRLSSQWKTTRTEQNAPETVVTGLVRWQF